MYSSLGERAHTWQESFDPLASSPNTPGFNFPFQARRKDRQLALHNTDLQLRLKAGQVEVEPPSLVSSDLSEARFIHSSITESLNGAVKVRGAKKMEIMTAIKDFQKFIYQLDWEHKRWVLGCGEF
jgi:hypothetical protein